MKTVETIVLFVLLVAFIQSATVPLVSAQEPTPRLPKMGPYAGPSDSNPYLAGYQENEDGWSSDHNTTKKVSITVSFPDTPAPGQTIQDVIPAGNYIAGGMFLQSQGGTAYTDYGWVASLSLDHEGTLQYNMAFYETYEMVPQHCWEIWSKAIVLDGVDPSTPVTLTMEWLVGGWVEWLYEIDGYLYGAGIFNAYLYREDIIQKFYIGPLYTDFPMYHWCYYYQFGIYSEDLITNGGWNVRLEHPKYYTLDGRWKCVLEAQSIGGYYAYMDSWWMWGGEDYDHIWARFYGDCGDPGTLPGFEVEFYYGDCHGYSRLPNHWTLWNNPPTEPEIPARPSGRISITRGYSYSYSTITVDPNDDDVTYYFDWGDGTLETSVGPVSSGVSVSASHTYSSTGYYTILVRAHDGSEWCDGYSDGLTVYVSETTSCVAEGTLITMANGSTKPVEKIKKGDQVLGYDPTTGSYMAENVLDTIKHHVEVLVNFNNGRLRVTPTDQPIFIRNATYEGWVRDPATIQVGWEIFQPGTGTWVTVTSMTYEEGKTRVYDLVLDGYQTYIANSLLLMDKC